MQRRKGGGDELIYQDVFPKLGEMGLLGVTVPEDMGGLGMGYLEHTVAMEGTYLFSAGEQSSLTYNER